jgi:hypothetical protein
VKFDRAARFRTDYAHLAPQERAMFWRAVQEINRAYARRTGWPVDWPAHLRIHPMKRHRGVWEMTWSFVGPDGRATFEFVDMGNGEFAIRWRRIGTHAVFGEP